MENCLVKTLKGTSSSNDLQPFEVFKFKTVANTAEKSDNWIQFGCVGTVTVNALNGAKMTLGSGTEEIDTFTWIDSGVTFYPANWSAEREFAVEKKYGLSEFGGLKVKTNLRDFRGLYSLKVIQFRNNPNIKGDIQYLKDCTLLETINITENASIYGDISVVSNFPNLKTLAIWSPYTNVYGSINSFSGCTQLTTITLNAGLEGNISTAFGACTSIATIMFASGNITGSIEDFVVAQRTAGRTTCDGVSCRGFGINNIKVANSDEDNYSGGDVTLTWTNNSFTFGSRTVNA